MAYKNRMKVCIITPYYHPIIGGITSYVSHLVKELKKDKNMAVDVIAKLSKEQEGVTAINVNKLFFIIKTYMVLQKKRYDVIHSHAHWYTLAPSILYKIFNPRTRVVHTFHTEPLGMMRGWKKKMFEWLLSKCSTVTFVSEALMEKVERNLKLDTKKKVVYAGVTEHEVSKEGINRFKEKYGLNESSPILSFVGPLVWKMKVEGVKMLANAFKDVVKDYSNAKLLIIGDGKYRADIKRLVKELDIENNVTFTGFLDDVFVPLSITDIYAHISLQEGGVSISLLEAMSLGKPVIATRIGGIPELIKDEENGILVDAEPGLIAKAIIKLYRDKKKMKELGEKAYITVITKHTWDKKAQNFIKIYCEK